MSHNILIYMRRIFLVIQNTYKYFLKFLFSLEKYKLLDKSNKFIDKFRRIIIIITILYQIIYYYVYLYYVSIYYIDTKETSPVILCISLTITNKRNY